MRQENKAAIADPRKFDAHIKGVVKARRDQEKQKKESSRRPQADPVKALFRSLETVESAVKSLTDSDLSEIKDIDAADKGQAIKKIYDTVEALTSFAEDRVGKLHVRRAVS